MHTPTIDESFIHPFFSPISRREIQKQLPFPSLYFWQTDGFCKTEKKTKK